MAMQIGIEDVFEGHNPILGAMTCGCSEHGRRASGRLLRRSRVRLLNQTFDFTGELPVSTLHRLSNSRSQRMARLLEEPGCWSGKSSAKTEIRQDDADDHDEAYDVNDGVHDVLWGS